MRRVNDVATKSRKKLRVVSKDASAARDLNSRVEVIQALIPLGLQAVEEELRQEVEELAGRRYSRGPVVRYGRNPGSVVLGGQRVAMDVPRVRSKVRGTEIALERYRRLHDGVPLQDAALVRVLKGLSCRDYREAALAVPEAFGLSASNVSRHFIRASQQQLKELLERDLSPHDIVVILIDGKAFAREQLITVVGVTMDGHRLVLGFIEAASEHARVAGDLVQQLLDRGLNVEAGVLVVVDGAKGLIAAVKKVLAARALIQRCQWHKRENVVAYVSKAEQPLLRKRLQRAYERPTYAEAKRELLQIRKDLDDRNQSAVASLDEGMEDTLTLHRLGLFGVLGKSLKTTNGIETINALVQQRCGKVDCWKNSSQRHRWLAAALLDIEPRLNRISGYQHLGKLREALQRELKLKTTAMKEAA